MFAAALYPKTKQVLIKQKPLLFWGLLIILIASFIFLRLYKLPISLNFFGDIGRDFVKLLMVGSRKLFLVNIP